MSFRAYPIRLFPQIFIWRWRGRLLSGLCLLWIAGIAQASDLGERIAPCTVCHGDQGRSGRDAYYPRIAGKPAGYLLNQLRHFQAGRRHYAWMTALVDPLPESYLTEIAEHFAALNPPYAPPTPTTLAPDQIELGRRLVLEGDPVRALPACVQCHGQQLMGLQPAIPGLLGLTRGYLVAQIGAWQAGSRRAYDPDCMAGIAKKLQPQESAAIAQWLAAQPVTAMAKPAIEPTRRLPLKCGGIPQSSEMPTVGERPQTESGHPR